MENKYYNRKTSYRSPNIYKSISRISNSKKRNVVRGYSVKEVLSSRDVNRIRESNSLNDSFVIGAILKGPNGLDCGEGEGPKKTCDDLFTIVGVEPLDWRSEVCYTSGYINSCGHKAIEMLDVIESFSDFPTLDLNSALELLVSLSQKFGASNFLSYKLAYLKVTKDIPTSSLELVTKIEDEMRHRENAGLHFSALENLSSKISLFEAAQRRVSGLVGRVKGDFRKALSLSNFVPTPVDNIDIAGFLLRATESCLLDTVYSILVIFNLKSKFPDVYKEFSLRLAPEFLEKIHLLIKLLSGKEYKKTLSSVWEIGCEDRDASLELYRISSAFLEYSEFALYRNKIDEVIGVRLLSEIIGTKKNREIEFSESKKLILQDNGTNLSEYFPIVLDEFYRTYLFLNMINNRSSLLGMSSRDIKFIFENTFGLQSLLSEDEMEAIRIMAPHEAKGLVTVLSLALHRQKSIDPDIDFEFRNSFIEHINESYSGSILSFIEEILIDSPEIANYLVEVLDEATLEKMYSLVQNASHASNVRCDILKAIGHRLSRIEYFIEADAITTRVKLSKLQQYFDSSRMYVDSISMKKWLDSNPTVSSEQYRTLFPRVEARIASINNENTSGGLYLVQLVDQSEYLIVQIVKDAFEQFCLNTEFGIESYLGRRIRHNTLDGVTTDTVDAVLRKSDYRVVLSNRQMNCNVENWMAAYKSIIDKLKRDYLQFKTNQSLFNAYLDTNDSFTKENIRKLSSSLRATGGSELLNDLVISFCWRQISPQLENAARFIKTVSLQEANASIDKYFSGYSFSSEGQLKTELHQAVNEVFKKISDWFQVPQTGFISASIRDLCHIIFMDLNKPMNLFDFSGDALDIKYTGISVHRLYDCLAVLLQNACKHGEDGTPILVNICNKSKSSDSVLDIITIGITSVVSEHAYQYSKRRISDAIEAEEAGKDMVTEGYTGIKKIKFITRLSEGLHTVRCKEDDADRKITIYFSIHAEKALEESASGGIL